MINSITSRNDKAHEEFIKKSIKNGNNLIIQIDHDTNTIRIIDMRRKTNVREYKLHL